MSRGLGRSSLLWLAGVLTRTLLLGHTARRRNRRDPAYRKSARSTAAELHRVGCTTIGGGRRFEAQLQPCPFLEESARFFFGSLNDVLIFPANTSSGSAIPRHGREQYLLKLSPHTIFLHTTQGVLKIETVKGSGHSGEFAWPLAPPRSQA